MRDAAPSPIDHVFGTLNGFHRSAALKAAFELGVFSAVLGGATTPEALAAATGASARGLRILCDGLVVLGFLTRADGGYGVPPDYAPFLDAASPLYLGTTIGFLHNAKLVDGFAHLTEAVRRGGAAPAADDALAPDHPMWVEFARSMAPLAGVTAEILAILLAAETLGPTRVLDVAAGHGLFGIALATRNPALEVTALDWPNVLQVAAENAAKAGVAARVHLRPGDALRADLGADYDLVLLPNIVHHFDEDATTTLFRRAHAALRPGGRVVVVEMVPDEDRSGPPTSVLFALVMLAMTPGGDAYRFSDYRRLLREAGFPDAAMHDLAPSIQRAIVATR